MQPSGGSARLQVSGSLGAEDPSGVQVLGRDKYDHCHGPGPPALPLLSLSAPESPHAPPSEGSHGQDPPWPLDPPRKSTVGIYWTVTDHSKYVQIRTAHGLGLLPLAACPVSHYPRSAPSRKGEAAPGARPAQHTAPRSFSALTLGPMMGLGILTMRRKQGPGNPASTPTSGATWRLHSEMAWAPRTPDNRNLST